MTRDRALAGFALLVAAAVIVLVARPFWVQRTTVKPHTTVLVAPPLTPLQARKAKRSSAGRSPDSRVSSSGSKNPTTTTAPKVLSSRPQKQSGAPRKRTTTKTKPKRSTPAPAAPTTTQPGQNQPPPASTQPIVTVPAPCVRLPPLAKVGDCG